MVFKESLKFSMLMGVYIHVIQYIFECFSRMHDMGGSIHRSARGAASIDD